jgi:hypothetical protein
MEDISFQINTLCEMWWQTRDLKKDQVLFQKNGKYYIKGSHNATRCWVWQVDQFINTEFEFITDDDNIETFMPKELNQRVKYRLISQLGVGIGLFYRDLLDFYLKYPINSIIK